MLETSRKPLCLQTCQFLNMKITAWKIFSKIDFKSAFWQIEIEEESRYLTVFHANDELYQYKRLKMGLKQSQGELNTALKPFFAQVSNAHLLLLLLNQKKNMLKQSKKL